MKIGKIRAIFKNDPVILVLILLSDLLILSIENYINPARILNIDEWLWIVRSYKYLHFAENLDFAGGIQTIHPGITVMSMGAISQGLADYLFKPPVFYHAGFMKLYLFALDVPIIIFMLAFFFSFYYILRKMRFERLLSFFVTMIISMKVFYIFGSSPVDKFSAISVILSLSLLLVYANEKYLPKKYLLLSSFFAAFGVLSKLSALAVVPFSLFILIYYAPLNAKKHIGAAKDYLLYIAFFILSSVLIFPGLLTDPSGSLKALSSVQNKTLVSGLGTPSESHAIFEKISYYFYSFFSGSLNPLAIGLFLFFLILIFASFARKGINRDFSEENLFYKNVFVLFSFAFFYIFIVIFFSSFLYYRYMMPAYLIFDVGAAIAFYNIIIWCRFNYFSKRSIEYVAIRGVLVFYAFQFAHLFLLLRFAVL